MKRRNFLAAAAITLTGCLSDTSSEENQPLEDESEPQSQSQEMTVVEDAPQTMGDVRIPERFEAGDRVRVEVEVQRGGPVKIAFYGENSSTITETVRTEGNLTTTVNETGDYYINIINSRVSDIRVLKSSEGS